MIELGWVMRNPGYGHPLRPEYILTEEGERWSGEALRLWESLGEWNEGEIALERWPLPILQVILEGAARFTQIKKACQGISPRALALALTRLESSGLVIRKVVEGRPPTSEYEATNWGIQLLGNLAGGRAG